MKNEAVPPPPRRTSLLRVLVQVLAAPIILFEEWGWEPLQRLVGLLARLRPIAWVESGITKLPPYGALALYATPMIALLPVKLLSLALLAGGHAVLGIATLLSAKVLGTAILARLFHLTKPRLMQIGWFASAYNRWVPWKNAIIERVHATLVWKQLHTFSAEVRKTVSGWAKRLRGSRGAR